MKVTVSILLVGLAAGLASCGSGSSVTNPPPSGCTPGSPTVCLTSSNTFNPSSVTIAKGSSVNWNNTTGVTHNVTFDAVAGAPASLPNFSSGIATATFAAAGTFPYHCTIHGLSMSGTVVVQ